MTRCSCPSTALCRDMLLLLLRRRAAFLAPVHFAEVLVARTLHSDGAVPCTRRAVRDHRSILQTILQDVSWLADVVPALALLEHHFAVTGSYITPKEVRKAIAGAVALMVLQSFMMRLLGILACPMLRGRRVVFILVGTMLLGLVQSAIDLAPNFEVLVPTLFAGVGVLQLAHTCELPRQTKAVLESVSWQRLVALSEACARCDADQSNSTKQCGQDGIASAHAGWCRCRFDGLRRGVFCILQIHGLPERVGRFGRQESWHRENVQRCGWL